MAGVVPDGAGRQLARAARAEMQGAGRTSACWSPEMSSSSSGSTGWVARK